MGNKNIKVLVVDDENDFRTLMSFWLESNGYKVISASCGEDAVRLVQSDSPDIIFMDLRMPVMDGAQTIAKIREFNKEIPVIIISAHVDDPIANTALSYGVEGVFYKGKDFEKGLVLLETILRTHKKLK